MDKREAAIELLNRRKARNNFKEFVLYFFLNEKGKEFIWNWHFDVITDELIKLMTTDVKLLAINIHPRSGKTEIITKLFPIWWMGSHQDFDVIATGYSSNLTQGFSSEARDYICSDTYNKLFPDVVISDTQNTKDHWETSHGKYYASGTSGTLTGKGADLFVIDDPLKPDDALMSTRTNLNKVNDWFGNTVISRLNTKIRDGVKVYGKILLIMQRLHDNDLCGHIYREYEDKFSSGEYRKLVIPAIANNDDKYRKSGEAMFPQLYDVEYLNDRKLIMNSSFGENFFSCQYQQDPIDNENAEFSRDYIMYKSSEEMANLSLKGVISIDPAESEKESADYRAVCAWGRGATGEYYKQSEVYGRWSTAEFINEIFNMQNAYRYECILEVNKSKLIGEMIRQEMKRRGLFFVLHDIINKGSKEERIRTTLQPLYQNRQVYHNKLLAYGEGEDELLRFPKSSFDDLIDADEMAVRWLRDKDYKKNHQRVRPIDIIRKIDSKYGDAYR